MKDCIVFNDWSSKAFDCWESLCGFYDANAANIRAIVSECGLIFRSPYELAYADTDGNRFDD